MTDSPMIQVLKYLEAGNTITRVFTHVRSIVYRYNPSNLRVEWCGTETIGTTGEFWVSVYEIGQLADLLPFIPQKPDLPQPTTHIRRVEL